MHLVSKIAGKTSNHPSFNPSFNPSFLKYGTHHFPHILCLYDLSPSVIKILSFFKCICNTSTSFLFTFLNPTGIPNDFLFLSMAVKTQTLLCDNPACLYSLL